VAEIRRRTEGLPRPKVYVENGSGGPGKIGNSYSGAMWGSMVGTAGGANIADGRIPSGWSPMQPEYVLAAAPEHLFILGASWTSAADAARAGFGVDEAQARGSVAPYRTRPGWDALPAVRSGGLHVIETSQARSLWGWAGMQYMAKAMHPDRFADVDPVASLRRYHEQYLPVSFEGCWMARA